MRNKILQKFYMLILLAPALILAAQSSVSITNTHKKLAVFYTLDGNIEKKYNTLIETKLKTIGFNLTDPHKRVNDQYKIKYGSTVLDVLSFMPIVQDVTILPLLNIDPRIAGFAPFNMLIYKKLNEDITHVGHLMPEVMLDILGIKNKEVRSKFITTFKNLDTMIAQELGGNKFYLPYEKLPKQTMINYEYTFERPEDIDDFIDEFQNTFELAFIDKGYLIAGFHNFLESTDNAEEILSEYDAFWTYSLCHLEFSYNMFDTEYARPEAGLFAPCTMYMYIRKETNSLVIGMFRLHNWSETLNITTNKQLTLIKKLDTQIPEILTSLGMKKLPNTNPLLNNTSRVKLKKTTTAQTKTPSKTNKQIEKNHSITQSQETKVEPHINTSIQKIKVGDKIITITIPQVPLVVGYHENNYKSGLNRGIKFSKRVPPNYTPHSFGKLQKEKKYTHTRIGEENKGRISAYLRAPFMEIDTIKKKLKSAHFDILTTTPLNKKGDLISLVFTYQELVKLASKPNRGFSASLRILIDTKEKKISITNPLYIAKGFLQDDFNEKVAKKTLLQLIALFPNLTNSQDTLKYQLLPNYQFMNGMPKYKDMITVASGENLLEKIKNNNKVVFKQTLENGATLIGIRLGKRTRQFTKRIGRNNAGMLPYPILIENGKAKILDPKYYISFMYPKLTMSEFMTIATIPDAILKDCERIFR